MESCVNYDEYDAYIHDYNYHTGSPLKNNISSQWTNLLNSYAFMQQNKKEDVKDEKIQHEIS